MRVSAQLRDGDTPAALNLSLGPDNNDDNDNKLAGPLSAPLNGWPRQPAVSSIVDGRPRFVGALFARASPRTRERAITLNC
jgi:hypothetical protein